MHRRLRIGLIAPPFLPVPPLGYGGTEAVVGELAEGLVRAGHDAVLYTTGDAQCSIPKKWTYPVAHTSSMGNALVELRHVMDAYKAFRDMDVIHDHTSLGPLYGKRLPGPPIVTTVHNRFDAENIEMYQHLGPEGVVVAISESQAGTAPEVPIARVIHHGIDVTRWDFGSGNGGYCAFLGRMSRDKGPHRAIRAVSKVGLPLIIAAKTPRTEAERLYHEQYVKPGLTERIWHVGEVGGRRKWELLANARCLVFPIRWDEPFGLVMLEAMACGTPVVAFAEGAAVEVVHHEHTGFLCETEEEMTEAILASIHLDRMECRRAVENHFSADRMAADYIDLFEEVRSSVKSGIAATIEPLHVG